MWVGCDVWAKQQWCVFSFADSEIREMIVDERSPYKPQEKDHYIMKETRKPQITYFEYIKHRVGISGICRDAEIFSRKL